MKKKSLWGKKAAGVKEEQKPTMEHIIIVPREADKSIATPGHGYIITEDNPEEETNEKQK